MDRAYARSLKGRFWHEPTNWAALMLSDIGGRPEWLADWLTDAIDPFRKFGTPSPRAARGALSAERVERRLPAVLAAGVEGRPMGAYEVPIVGPYWVAGRRTDAPHAGCMAASRTPRMKRLVYMWVAAAVVLVVSIGETAAQSKSGETATHPKKILFLHSFGPHFEQWATQWGRGEVPNRNDHQPHAKRPRRASLQSQIETNR